MQIKGILTPHFFVVLRSLLPTYSQFPNIGKRNMSISCPNGAQRIEFQVAPSFFGSSTLDKPHGNLVLRDKAYNQRQHIKCICSPGLMVELVLHRDNTFFLRLAFNGGLETCTMYINCFTTMPRRRVRRQKTRISTPIFALNILSGHLLEKTKTVLRNFFVLFKKCYFQVRNLLVR